MAKDLLIHFSDFDDSKGSFDAIVQQVVELGYNDYHQGYISSAVGRPFKYLCLELQGYPRPRDICLSQGPRGEDIVVATIEDFLQTAAEYAKEE